jgi:hypothetical protein
MSRSTNGGAAAASGRLLARAGRHPEHARADAHRVPGEKRLSLPYTTHTTLHIMYTRVRLPATGMEMAPPAASQVVGPLLPEEAIEPHCAPPPPPACVRSRCASEFRVCGSALTDRGSSADHKTYWGVAPPQVRTLAGRNRGAWAGLLMHVPTGGLSVAHGLGRPRAICAPQLGPVCPTCLSDPYLLLCLNVRGTGHKTHNTNPVRFLPAAGDRDALGRAAGHGGRRAGAADGGRPKALRQSSYRATRYNIKLCAGNFSHLLFMLIVTGEARRLVCVWCNRFDGSYRDKCAELIINSMHLYI